MIVFKNVTKRYGDSTALQGVSFSIAPGEFVIITGKSGAGKSTLGRLLIRDTLPTEGEIAVGEFDLLSMKSKEIPILRRQIGIVFQDFRLLPDRTAAENIALSMEILGKPRAVIEATVTELLSIISLSDKAQRFPSELSGGEAQRVVIARAMATEPAVVFADEPTGNLDTQTGWQIIELLQKINESGTAVILATHNQEHVDRLKHRTISLENGRLVEDKPRMGVKTTQPEPEAKDTPPHSRKPTQEDAKHHHKESKKE